MSKYDRGVPYDGDRDERGVKPVAPVPFERPVRTLGLLVCSSAILSGSAIGSFSRLRCLSDAECDADDIVCVLAWLGLWAEATVARHPVPGSRSAVLA